jgi:hypothetical protein
MSVRSPLRTADKLYQQNDGSGTHTTDLLPPVGRAWAGIRVPVRLPPDMEARTSVRDLAYMRRGREGMVSQ